MKSVTKSEHTLTVFDGENEVWAELSFETQKVAAYVHQQVVLGSFISAVALKKIFDERLYLALGCQTKEEYVTTQTPYGIRQAQRLVAVANKFDAVSKQLAGQELKQITSSQDSENATSMSHDGNLQNDLTSIGITKLYELTKIDDSDLTELLDKGTVNVNGEVLDLEELKEMTVRDTNIKIARATKEYKDKIKKLSTKLAQAEEEAKLLKSENSTMLDENKSAKQLEQMYGSIASTLSAKQRALDDARKLLNQFNETMVRCGVNTDDPDAVRVDFLELLKKMDDVKERLIGCYDEVIAAA